jgi:hypothetical protein
MKIRLSSLAPVLLSKRIQSCFKKAGLECKEINSYGEIWNGTHEQVILCAKKLNTISKAHLYTEIIR